MKNLLKSTLGLAGLLLLLSVVNVQAQIPSKATASVPFDFTAGKSSLKSGTYSVRRMNGNTLAIQNGEGKTVAVVNAPLTLGSRDFKAGERLVFNRYGDEYFLSQVWLSVDSGRQLLQSAKEAKTAQEFKLAQNGAKPERIEVAIK